MNLGSSMNISGDSNNGVPLDQYLTDLNANNFMHVRRPPEDQVLAFLDYEGPDLGQKMINHNTFPESLKDIKSKYSSRSRKKIEVKQKSVNQSDLLEMNSPIDIQAESPIPNMHKITEERKKSNRYTTLSPYAQPKSPRRKSKLSHFFSKFSGKMVLIQKFIEKLKLLSISIQSRLLQYSDIEVFQDYSSDCQIVQQNDQSIKFFEVQQSKNKETCSIQRMIHIWDKYKYLTLNPQSDFVIFWEVSKLVLNLLLLFQWSMQLTFSLNMTQVIVGSQTDSNVFWEIVLVYFLIDILISFKTGFYVDGEINGDQSQVAKRYIQNFLIIDLITLIPLVVNSQSNDDYFALKIANLLLLIKIKSLRRTFEAIKGRLLTNPNLVIIYRFISVIGMIFLYAHIFGLLWYLIGTVNSSQNWIVNKGINDQPWYVLYSFSIYWAVMTMTTVGYGDINPQNYDEALFSVCTMFIASIIFAYSLNTIGAILNEMNGIERKLNENMAVINKFMSRNGLSPEVQFRVRKYLQSTFKNELKYRIGEEKKVLERLPIKLQDEIQFNLYSKFIKSIPILIKHFSQKTLIQLTKRVEEHRAAPGFCVTTMGSSDNLGLYQLLSGEGQIMIQTSQKKYIFKKLKKGDFFSNHGFYNEPHIYSVQITQESTYAFLSLDSIKKVVRQSKEDYVNIMNIKQAYRMLVDLFTFTKSYADLGMKCSSCGSVEHDINTCHKLHLNLRQSLVISKYLFSTPNDRISKSRNQRRSTNAKFGQKLFEDAVSLFIENNQSILVEESDIQAGERTELIANIMQEYKKQYRTNEPPQQRTRKRSHSLNSLSVNSQDKYQKSMSGYKSQDSRMSIDKISGITPRQLPIGSQLSSSSFNLLIKQGSVRKTSKMESDSNSNNLPSKPPFSHSSSGNNKQNPNTETEKSFQRHFEDSLHVTHQRQQKVARPNLAVIQSLEESGAEQTHPKNHRQHHEVEFHIDRPMDMKDRQSERHHSLYSYSKQHTQRSQRSDKKQDTNKFKTDTYRQFNDQAAVFIIDDQFDKPLKSSYYFPNHNKDQVLERFNRQQYKRLAQIQQLL